DYWLVGNSWTRVCRFDGTAFAWQPLTVPAPTVARVTRADGVRLGGAIASGACLAWNDCWLPGSYGTQVDWDGTQLRDASPRAAKTWLQPGSADAAARVAPSGQAFAAAVALSGRVPYDDAALAASPAGGGPLQLFTLSTGAFRPLPALLPPSAVPGDPYR